MMIQPNWCRECIFAYPGMTIEDYLYLQYLIKTKSSRSYFQLHTGRKKLLPYANRTKEEVFKFFDGDLDYKFNVDIMG